jgi:hypothetical protein
MRKELQDLVDVCVICIIAVVPVALIAIFMYGLFSLLAPKACAMEKLGTISRNPYIGDSTSNPYSLWNNPYYPDSPRNPYGPYGNPYSPYSANNPYSTMSPGIYGYADEGYGNSTDSYANDGGYEE